MMWIGLVFNLIFWLFIIYLIVRLVSGRQRRALRWLRHELPIWEKNNIISTEQGDSLLGFYKLKRLEPGKKMDMVKVLTLTGAIFVGLGVLFFVASNWQRLPGSFRVALLLTVTISTFYAGYRFTYVKDGFVNLGKGLLLLTALLWGGTVSLIGQIYNIPVSQNWYIVLLWAFPILPIAILFKNHYVHILASVLFLVWNFLYSANNNVANYAYPVIVGIFMLPTAGELTASRRINILGLILASFYCAFNKFEWLSLLITLLLLIFYMLNKEYRSYLYAATLSVISWVITYYTVRDHEPNLYFIIPVGFLLYLTYKDEIKENLALCLAGIVVWFNLILSSFSIMLGYSFNTLYFFVLQAGLGMSIYMLGVASKQKGYPFVQLYKVFGYLLTFLSIYILSFRGILEIEMKINFVYYLGSLFLIFVIILLGVDEIRQGGLQKKSFRLEILALCVALLGSMILLNNPRLISANVVVANIVLVVFALINIFLGVELKSPGVFTSGIVIFALFIITRYIDVGWKLKEKSLFFIIGGLLILFLGVFLEKQRKKIIEGMK